MVRNKERTMRNELRKELWEKGVALLLQEYT
jgi:hypothetical protein